MVARIVRTLGLLVLSSLPALAASPLTVRWQPAALVNGAPVFFQVTSRPSLKCLDATWLGQNLVFTKDDNARTWYALAGISLKTQPGSYPLRFTAWTAAGKLLSFDRTIRVSKARYKVVVALSVPKKFTEPDPKQLELIAHDKTLKQDAFQKSATSQQWTGAFRPPVDASFSDVFGTQRKFNGTVLSVHQGLDYRVPKGTPVSALNSGTVLLAQPLYFEGNCIVIDHGEGFLSLYLHLSKISVKEGDHVDRGEPIGLSGATGRATGAHLHLAVRWRGEYLNPATLLALRLPGTSPDAPSAPAK
jgi:murein DD-endopeptidase MepM/ murein hydrolase activator NlpD